ncbi:divalent cation tolerance protein CutA [Vicingus serpentipes]|uniref:Divalent cation tolerance protein CutA n=1 Tax=Vicingus serpentipes TaxID=1926625 RepID=A0A5C6RZB8_9FLAO|nr:divalent cation tolerance protein CutA [Vicingus serpentipes]TXB67119.1 divalent cation tolerance protein CutA [Vicingus serpentipes]
MVLLHVVSNDENQANEIVDFLTKDKLILEAVILEKVKVRRRNAAGELDTFNQIMIMAKTKALLFNHIADLLKKKYSSNMPSIYSLPIVNMDWDQVNELVKETAKI